MAKFTSSEMAGVSEMEVNGHDFSSLVLIARLVDAGLSPSEEMKVQEAVGRMRTDLGKDLAQCLLTKSNRHHEAVVAIKKAAGVL